jgi:hypothetical protein
MTSDLVSFSSWVVKEFSSVLGIGDMVSSLILP